LYPIEEADPQDEVDEHDFLKLKRKVGLVNKKSAAYRQKLGTSGLGSFSNIKRTKKSSIMLALKKDNPAMQFFQGILDPKNAMAPPGEIQDWNGAHRS